MGGNWTCSTWAEPGGTGPDWLGSEYPGAAWPCWDTAGWDWGGAANQPGWVTTQEPPGVTERDRKIGGPGRAPGGGSRAVCWNWQAAAGRPDTRPLCTPACPTAPPLPAPRMKGGWRPAAVTPSGNW